MRILHVFLFFPFFFAPWVPLSIFAFHVPSSSYLSSSFSSSSPSAPSSSFLDPNVPPQKNTVGPGHRSFGPNVASSFSPQVHSLKLAQVQLTSPLTEASDLHLLKETTSAFLVSMALSFLQRQTGVDTKDLIVKNRYTSSHNGITHIYVRQSIRGLEILNADANVNVDRYGSIVSYGESLFRLPSSSAYDTSSNTKTLIPEPPSTQLILEDTVSQQRVSSSRFFNTRSIKTNTQLMSPLTAFLKLTDFLNIRIQPALLQLRSDFASSSSSSSSFIGHIATLAQIDQVTQGDIPISLAYVHQDGQLNLVYSYEFDVLHSWYHAQVCAYSGTVLAITDWVADAAFKVYPLGVNDPDDGPRVVFHPKVSSASPAGWTMGSTTRGNNVEAQENLKGDTLNKPYEQNYRPEGGFKLNFKFPLHLDAAPQAYLDAAITQLFYMNNMMHDLFYNYGFTEETGNFQLSNFGRPGLEGDPVIAHAQDGSGFNNANFATPPDGRSGRMRMYIWNTADPNRDGDLENGIVIHEYSHGISTRLVGGPLNSGCLAWGEAGGMGEGWGDVFATILRMTPSKYTRDHVWEMGKYANGGQSGIRKYPYANDMTMNPSTFEVLNQPAYWGVHAKGEVWAMILLEVYWNLVDKLGFTEDWFSASSHYGNTLFLQLIIDGMKFQPCRPTFLQARDAILQAEVLLTQGKHFCSIWKGFAKRGLGVSAKKIPSSRSPLDDEKRVNGFDVPDECNTSSL